MNTDIDTLLKFGETNLLRGLNILCGIYGHTNLEMVCKYISSLDNYSRVFGIYFGKTIL